MTIRDKAHIAGAWEHPTRLAPAIPTPQLHAACAARALADAGLSAADVDGYFCADEAITGPRGGMNLALTVSAAAIAGTLALAEAGVAPAQRMRFPISDGGGPYPMLRHSRGEDCFAPPC